MSTARTLMKDIIRVVETMYTSLGSTKDVVFMVFLGYGWCLDSYYNTMKINISKVWINKNQSRKNAHLAEGWDLFCIHFFRKIA